MKMLYSVFVLLYLTGIVNSQAVGEACGDNNACDENLLCQNSKCVAKAGGTCTETSQCITDATCTGEEGLKECTCTNKVPSDDNTKCLNKAGVKCTETNECLTGATCEGQGEDKVCTCATSANTEKTMCLKKVEEQCSADGDCLGNGMCTGDKCKCKANYLSIFDKTACKKAPGQSCESGECGENAKCEEKDNKKTCVCKDTFYAKDGERCGKKVDEVCAVSKDCVPNAECSNDKKCKCMDDYSDDGDKFCSGASAVMASLTLLLAAFATSRWI